MTNNPDYIEEDRGYATPCWIWQKYIETKGRSKGYGKKSWKGKTRRAHRVYYEKEKGITLHKDEHLDHLCEQRNCVNPDHLEPVGHRENTDRRSKFSWEKAAELREFADIYSQQKLTEIFGISRRYVRDILDDNCWVANGTQG